MVTKSKTFCLHPFTHLEIANDGSVGPCCRFDRYYKMDNGVTANISDSFDSIVNSRHSLELKKALIEGVQHPGCHRCWRDESAGLNSQRIRYNNCYSEYFDKFTDPSHFELLSFDLKLGNTCNQMCVICHPGNSSMIQSEHRILFNDTTLNPGLDWYRYPENMDKIEQHLNSILHIDFFGGEPWLIKQQWEILRKLIDSGRSKEVTLNYATNGSLFKKEYFEMFNKFKSVSILFSADGIKDTFEYARYPAKWQTFQDNLNQSLVYLNPNLTIKIAYTVSIYSVFNIFESLEYYASVSKNLKVWFNIVNEEEYSIKNLPSNIKDSLISKLENDWNTNWPTSDNNAKDSILNELRKSRNPNMWDKFIKITSVRDQHRGVSMSTIIPI